MDEKVIKVFKINIFNDKVVKIGLINDKLSYIGFEKDSIYDFYKSYTVRNVLKDDKFKKYIDLLNKFENHQQYSLDFEDLYLPNLSHNQIEILKEISKLDYGQYLSLGEFAKTLKRVDNLRLITQTIRKNPIILLIPCHRLFSQNITFKYRSGRDIKNFLIKNKY